MARALLDHERIQDHIVRFNQRERLADAYNPLETLTDGQVFSRYRFHKPTVNYLVNLVGERIVFANDRGGPYPVLLQVLITLRYVASNSFYQVVGDTMHPKLSTSGCWQAVKRVTQVLTDLADGFINLRAEDCADLHQEFYAIADFPKTIGAIDGTQIKIMRPSVDDYFVYRNRHQVYAINVQAVASPRFLILDLNVDWPGSAHDSRVFQESGIYQRLVTKELKGHLVGDSGYTLERFVLTPYLDSDIDHQVAYDTAQKKTRVVVEQLFGVWKRRFLCLKTEVRARNPIKAANIIWACGVLHNIGLVRGDIVVGPRELEEINDEIRAHRDDEVPQPDRWPQRDSYHYRDWFSLHYFGPGRPVRQAVLDQ